MLIHRRVVGDTLSPLPVTIQRDGAAVDLTNRVVKVQVNDSDGNVVVAPTTAGVTVTSAVDGEVDYDFASTGVDEGGTFYVYFLVHGITGGGSDTEFDTYPPEGVVVIIEDPQADRTPTETIDVISAANGPKSMRTAEGSVEERSIDELIAADRYAAAKAAADRVPWGIRIARTQPAGINGRN